MKTLIQSKVQYVRLIMMFTVMINNSTTVNCSCAQSLLTVSPLKRGERLKTSHLYNQENTNSPKNGGVQGVRRWYKKALNSVAKRSHD